MARHFTSDPHFYHKNIIKYCKRPFNDPIHMNRVLIERHNSVVKPEDETYYMGDLGFCSKKNLYEIMKQLNGKKYLIRGNHDEMEPQDYIDIGFEFVTPIMTINIPEVGAVGLAHDPSNSIMIKSIPWLCGHLHDLFKVFHNCVNVGVDVWDFYPVAEDKVKEIMLTWKKFGIEAGKTNPEQNAHITWRRV